MRCGQTQAAARLSCSACPLCPRGRRDQALFPWAAEQAHQRKRTEHQEETLQEARGTRTAGSPSLLILRLHARGIEPPAAFGSIGPSSSGPLPLAGGGQCPSGSSPRLLLISGPPGSLSSLRGGSASAPGFVHKQMPSHPDPELESAGKPCANIKIVTNEDCKCTSIKTRRPPVRAVLWVYPQYRPPTSPAPDHRLRGLTQAQL